jgi:hypothetical protein
MQFFALDLRQLGLSIKVFTFELSQAVAKISLVSDRRHF